MGGLCVGSFDGGCAAPEVTLIPRNTTPSLFSLDHFSLILLVIPLTDRVPAPGGRTDGDRGGRFNGAPPPQSETRPRAVVDSDIDVGGG